MGPSAPFVTIRASLYVKRWPEELGDVSVHSSGTCSLSVQLHGWRKDNAVPAEFVDRSRGVGRLAPGPQAVPLSGRVGDPQQFL